MVNKKLVISSIASNAVIILSNMMVENDHYPLDQRIFDRENFTNLFNKADTLNIKFEKEKLRNIPAPRIEL